MDASRADRAVPSGTYRLVPAARGGLAKMDAWTVELTVLSKGYELASKAGAILQREDVIGPAEPRG
jgi:hypothetical protein